MSINFQVMYKLNDVLVRGLFYPIFHPFFLRTNLSNGKLNLNNGEKFFLWGHLFFFVFKKINLFL